MSITLELKFYFRNIKTHKEDTRSAEKEVIHNHDLENEFCRVGLGENGYKSRCTG